MEKQFDSGLVWFRRDLRVDDHAALQLALRLCRRVYCAFVFDREILDPLPRTDRRVNQVTKPMKIKVEFKGEVNGAEMSGKAKAGFMGSYPFTATKA